MIHHWLFKIKLVQNVWYIKVFPFDDKKISFYFVEIFE